VVGHPRGGAGGDGAAGEPRGHPRRRVWCVRQGAGLGGAAPWCPRAAVGTRRGGGGWRGGRIPYTAAGELEAVLSLQLRSRYDGEQFLLHVYHNLLGSIPCILTQSRSGSTYPRLLLLDAI